MKPQLKGDLATLYAAQATKRRKTKTFEGVEYVYKRDLSTYDLGVTYLICCAGINIHGVPIAAYFEPGKDTAYFWQYADKVAVADIMEHPENAYNWMCVKNGIKKDTK